jgi:AcrR family transcriptional regulator
VPRPRLADERRPQIVAAAERAIAEHGFESVRLLDVAEEAGLAVGTVQHYFGSRDELLVEALRSANRSGSDRLHDAIEATVDPWERLQAVAAHVAGLERWGLWLDFWAVAARRPELRTAMAAAYEDWRAPILAAIEEGIASGRFAPRLPAVEIASLVVAIADGIGIQRGLGVAWLGEERVRELLVGALASELFGRSRAPFP